MIKIENLHVEVEGNKILKGIDLEVKAGETHAIMGPNGSGKSTLAQVLAGHEDYEVTEGSVEYLGKDLLDMDVDERACEGIFLAFLYPVELPGVRTWQFLKASLDSIRSQRGLEELSIRDFDKLLEKKRLEVEMPSDLVKRSVNEGFSGGEKKRNEILQLSLLNPDLALLDETDSGLDIDALCIVSEGVNKYRGSDKSVMLVTHYQRILDYIAPDYVHVLLNGKIVKSGNSELARELEKKGYEWVREHSIVGNDDANS